MKSGKCRYPGGVLSDPGDNGPPNHRRRGGAIINMRDKIIGAIGIVWGGGMLLRWLMSGPPAGIGGYQGGQTAGALLGAVMLVAGLYRFFKRPD